MNFADQARRAARSLSRNGRQPLTRKDLGDRLGIQTRKDMDRVDAAVKALIQSGDLVRQGPGIYRYTGQVGQPNQYQVMWRYLRARRTVTAAELQEVSGATAIYVQERLQSLLELKLVRLEGDHYRLISDPGPEPPRNEAKLDYLKRRRQQQKQALASLDSAFAAVARECPGKNGESLRRIATARLAVSRLEE